jgi:hypothetical protein
MNAVNQGGIAPELGTPIRWALHCARDHLDDWRHVRSIITLMSNALQNEINEAHSGKRLMEPDATEEYMANLDWLMEVMEDRRRTLSKDLTAAGVG